VDTNYFTLKHFLKNIKLELSAAIQLVIYSIGQYITTLIELKIFLTLGIIYVYLHKHEIFLKTQTHF